MIGANSSYSSHSYSPFSLLVFSLCIVDTLKVAYIESQTLLHAQNYNVKSMLRGEVIFGGKNIVVFSRRLLCGTDLV